MSSFHAGFSFFTFCCFTIFLLPEEFPPLSKARQFVSNPPFPKNSPFYQIYNSLSHVPTSFISLYFYLFECQVFEVGSNARHQRLDHVSPVKDLFSFPSWKSPCPMKGICSITLW